MSFDTDTWEPGGQNTQRHGDASRGTRYKGQLVYTMQDVTLKHDSLNFAKCDEDMMIERTISGITGLEVMTALYVQGHDKIAVLNQRNSDVIIKKGVKIAEKGLVKPKETNREDTEKQNKTGIKEVNDDRDRVDRLAEIWTELGLEKNEILKDKPK